MMQVGIDGVVIRGGGFLHMPARVLTNRKLGHYGNVTV